MKFSQRSREKKDMLLGGATQVFVKRPHAIVELWKQQKRKFLATMRYILAPRTQNSPIWINEEENPYLPLRRRESLYYLLNLEANKQDWKKFMCTLISPSSLFGLYNVYLKS